MSYVDGFVVPVPAGNKEAYRAAAQKMTAICKRLGAIRVVECWGDDVPDGKVDRLQARRRCARTARRSSSRWIEWPSKEVRDKGNKVDDGPAIMEPFEDDALRNGASSSAAPCRYSSTRDARASLPRR